MPAAPQGPTDLAQDVQKDARRQERMRERSGPREKNRTRAEERQARKKAKERARIMADVKRQQAYVRSMAPKLGFDPGRPVTVIPPLRPGHQQVDFRPFKDGLAHVRISYDPARNTYFYEVIEPTLLPTEQEALEFLRDTLIRTMTGRTHHDSEDWEQYLTDAIMEAIRDHSVLLDDVGTQRVRYHLLREFLGFGPIDVMMQDPLLEDISCDGPRIPLYLFHREYESIVSNVSFEEDALLDAFVIRLAQQSGKHISIADPLLDATLPDGSRLQATLSREITTRGSSFTIRKFRTEPLTPSDLVQYGTFSAEMAGYFWFLLEHGMSMILAGGTASGKTTSLNAVCQFIPPQKKIVSIEDTREINLSHENWIAGVTRSGFGGESASGRTARSIDMYALLGAAMRQRPEYLLVGEVRGPEAVTLFQAMATGHAVYSTMHADSVESAVYRLENEPINVPRLMLQTIEVMAIQAHVRVKDRTARRITDVTEVVGFDAETGDLLTNHVFEWDPATDRHSYLGKSFVLERIQERQNRTEEDVEREWEDRVRVIEWMRRTGIRRFDHVADVVANYYRHPKQLMQRIAADEAKAGVQVRLRHARSHDHVARIPAAAADEATSSSPPRDPAAAGADTDRDDGDGAAMQDLEAQDVWARGGGAAQKAEDTER